MMNTKKGRNKIYNVLMTAAIVIIAAAGILGAGMIRGWFDKGPSEGTKTNVESITLVTAEKTGGANIYRSGVAYALKEETILRAGDEVETLNLSSITLICNDDAKSYIKLDENSRLLVKELEGESLSLELVNGAFFADIQSPARFTIQGNVLDAENAVLSGSAPYGSGSIAVLGGSAKLEGEELAAGKAASVFTGEQAKTEVRDITLSSLSGFEMDELALVSKDRSPVFTADEINKLLAEREEEKQSVLEAAFLDGEAEALIAARRESVEKDSQVKPGAADGKGQASGEKAEGATNSDAESAGEGNAEELRLVATIEIRCDTILNNLGNLAEGKNSYVPSNGKILKASKITFTEGETAFDVLKRACSLAGIPLEYAWTPMYNSYYVEGINNLYEFDCGEQSGWMYKVNGWFPNYGASAYKLEDGDVVVWCYTCNGLGADVGGGM